MALKPRTFRRIILIGSLATLVLAVILGNFVVRPWQRQRGIEQHRAEGMQAAEAGQHDEAVALLGRYLRQTPDAAPEYYLAHARSRLKYQASDGGHVRVAVQSFREYLKAVPDDVEVAKELLPLFNLLGMHIEAQALAESLREKYGDTSSEVLREEILALEKLDREDSEIEPLLQMLIAHDDLAFVDIFQYVEWLRARGRHDEARAWIEDRVESGNDGVATRLMGFWVKDFAETGLHGEELADYQATELAGILGLSAETGEWIAEPDYLTAPLVSVIDRVFNMIGRQDLSLEVRLASSQIVKDASSLIWTARRMYWQKDFDRLHALGLVNDEGDRIPDVLGYRVLAYRIDGQEDLASELIEELGTITLDFRAQAWLEMLEGMEHLEAGESVLARPLVKEAVDSYFGEPMFHLVMGDVHNKQGRLMGAKDEWDKSHSFANEIAGNLHWLEPKLRIIQAYTQLGRLSEVVDEVDGLLRIAPRNPVSILVWLRSYAELARSEELDPVKTQEILNGFLQGASGLTAEGRALYAPQVATLHASIGQASEASAVLTEAIASSPDQELMNQIFAVDQYYQLGVMKSAGLEASKVALSSPNSALRYALAMYTNGNDIEGGLQIFEQGLSGADVGDQVDWAIAQARFLDICNDSRAAEAWNTLRRENPQNVDLLYQAVESQSLGSDLAVVDEIINQIVEATATQGKTLSTRLRLARASAITQQTPMTRGHRTEALEVIRSVVASEPENVKARNMLGRLLEMRPSPILPDADSFEPDLAGAIQEYVTISRQLKGTGAQKYLLEAVDLSLEVGDKVAARQYLFELDTRFSTDYELLPEVARRLEGLGDFQTAQTIYERVYRNAQSPQQAMRAGLSLANVFVLQNQRSQANALLTDLRGAETLSPEALFELASLFTKNGNRPEGDLLAKQGEQYGLDPVEAKMVYARYAGSFISQDVYESTLREIVTIDPLNEDAWTMLVRRLLRSDREQEAKELVAQAMQGLPESKELRVLELMASGETVSASQLLDIGGLEGNEFLEDMVSRVDAYMEIREGGSLDQRLRMLTSLLDDYLHSEPLQRFAIQELQVVPQVPLGVLASYAQRASRNFPEDSSLMRIACATLLQLGNASQVIELGKLWRANVVGSPLEPDLALAQANTQLENYARAVGLLQPYLLGALNTPGDVLSARVLHGYSHAQLMRGENPKVTADRLEPLLSDTESFGKQVWLNLIGKSVPTHQEAARWISILTKYTTEDDALALAAAWIGVLERFEIQEQSYAQSAIDLLEPLVLAKPQEAGYINALGRAYAALAECQGLQAEKARSYQRAIELLDQAEELEPDNLLHLAQSAAYATSANDYKSAEMRYRKLLDKDLGIGQFSASVQNNLAMLIERQSDKPEDLQEALGLSVQATELFDIPTFWGTRGWVELALGMYSQAESSFRQATVLDTLSVEGWAGLAIVQYQLGEDRHDDAQRSFERAIRLAENEPMSDDLRNRLVEQGDPGWLSPQPSP